MRHNFQSGERSQNNHHSTREIICNMYRKALEGGIQRAAQRGDSLLWVSHSKSV